MKPITKWIQAEIEPLVKSSIKEGYHHITRLKREYEEGSNRFNQEGEALFGAYCGVELAGICGLNRDPLLGRDGVGRVRRLYVIPEYRRSGIGRKLMEQIIREAGRTFHCLVLRTDTAAADLFYRSIGFDYLEGQELFTHRLILQPSLL